YSKSCCTASAPQGPAPTLTLRIAPPLVRSLVHEPKLASLPSRVIGIGWAADRGSCTLIGLPAQAPSVSTKNEATREARDQRCMAEASTMSVRRRNPLRYSALVLMEGRRRPSPVPGKARHGSPTHTVAPLGLLACLASSRGIWPTGRTASFGDKALGRKDQARRREDFSDGLLVPWIFDFFQKSRGTRRSPEGATAGVGAPGRACTGQGAALRSPAIKPVVPCL